MIISAIADRSGTRFSRAGKQNLAVFFVAFTLLLLLKLPNLSEVPTWDGAMSVFPAGITLADSGFDLPELLETPTYAEGGPNVHALSLVTWITAVILMGGGDLVSMHILHLLIAAGAAVAVFRLAELVLGIRLAIPATAASMLSPLVLTQVGFMYLEVGLLLTTAMAGLTWIQGRSASASLWATLAVLVKTSGIIVAVGLLVADLFGRERPQRDPVHIAIRFGIPTLAFALKMAFSPKTTIGTFTAEHGLRLMGGFLLKVPDLAVLTVAYVAVIVLAAIKSRTAVTSSPQVVIAAIIASFLAFYVLFSAMGGSPLPRYWVQIVPLVIIGLAVALRSHVPKKVLIVLLLMLAGFFGFNRNGLLYPQVSNNNFAVAERSGEYRDLLALHRQGSAMLEQVGASRDVFYTLPYSYFVSYPAMGYVNAVPLLGHSILHEEPYRQGHLQDFPESFFMLYEFSWLGGGTIKSVWDQALADPTRAVAVTTLGSPPFESLVIQVDTLTTPQSGS